MLRFSQKIWSNCEMYWKLHFYDFDQNLEISKFKDIEETIFSRIWNWNERNTEDNPSTWLHRQWKREEKLTFDVEFELFVALFPCYPISRRNHL